MSREIQGETLHQRVIELYGKKIDLLADMKRLTSERAVLNEAEQPEEILALIEERQACIEKIDVIDAEIERISRGINAPAQGILPEDFIVRAGETIRVQRQKCIHLIKDIQELDRLQKPKFELQLRMIKELREKLTVSRRTAGAYRKNAPLSGSVFIDKRK